MIKRIAPDCTEGVNYRIPVFRLMSDFVAISAAKRHCDLRTISKAIPAAMIDELKAFGVWTSGTTFHTRPGSEFPLALLESS